MADLAQTSHANWVSQVKRGVLELCILNLLEQESMYGYQIVKRITAIPGLIISEGTIYPLLSRLKTQGLVASSLVESPQGPARRTYVLTDEGREYLKSINHGWLGIVQAVNQCLNGSSPAMETRHENT